MKKRSSLASSFNMDRFQQTRRDKLDKDMGQGGDDLPAYIIVDPSWKSEHPDPLQPRSDNSRKCPPGMNTEEERQLWGYLQECKAKAKAADEKKGSAGKV